MREKYFSKKKKRKHKTYPSFQRKKKKKNSIHRTTSTFPSHPFIAQRMKKKFYF